MYAAIDLDSKLLLGVSLFADEAPIQRQSFLSNSPRNTISQTPSL